MVLENSSSKQADESFDSIPTSDNDPYATSEQGQDQNQGNSVLSYRIESDKLPQSMPIFGPLFGYNQERLVRVTSARINAATNIIKRPLRQEEVDAIAYYDAKVLQINSYAPLAGLSTGIYRAIQTAPTFRFPFYQPNLKTFNSSIFPHARMPYIKGGSAVIAWHVFRGLWYSYIGQSLSKAIFGVYAAGMTAQRYRSDPRLKDITAATMEQFNKLHKNLPSPAGLPRPPMKPGQGQSQTQNKQEYDDASPTSGAEWYGEDNTPGASQTTPQTFPPTNSWPQKQQTSAQTSSQAPAQEEKSFSVFDDASPTGEQGMNTNTTSPSSSGSAWDRIRRGEKPASTSNTPSSQSSGWARVQRNASNTSGDEVAHTDSFAFSKTEEERNLAQARAQKEFDTRVEKERRGESFSAGEGGGGGGDGDQKRW
ncbi:hypothetical protein SBOR_5612 [Sclerotinia borealis F-4128]|uniref:Endo-1,3(4)-beta-glucanase n=1 Tax=Sclerotinia borealis (strain F-4128) TaxID=1432307 RepID=W9CHI2_SCLBF|nr:hypothetical protein SBOR_5612 [Sclerotinia borealis F-4128]